MGNTFFYLLKWEFKTWRTGTSQGEVGQLMGRSGTVLRISLIAGPLATGNLATDLVTSPQKAE